MASPLEQLIYDTMLSTWKHWTERHSVVEDTEPPYFMTDSSGADLIDVLARELVDVLGRVDLFEETRGELQPTSGGQIQFEVRTLPDESNHSVRLRVADHLRGFDRCAKVYLSKEEAFQLLKLLAGALDRVHEVDTMWERIFEAGGKSQIYRK